jgi:hypothetical protein
MISSGSVGGEARRRGGDAAMAWIWALNQLEEVGSGFFLLEKVGVRAGLENLNTILLKFVLVAKITGIFFKYKTSKADLLPKKK